MSYLRRLERQTERGKDRVQRNAANRAFAKISRLAMRAPLLKYIWSK